MNFRKKLYLLGILVVLIVLVLLVFPASGRAVSVYNAIFYYPFQSLRDILFGYLPFSVGDVLYVVAGGYLLWVISKWVRYVARFSASRQALAASMLNTLNALLFVYLFFVLGWGANYYKQPLAKEWNLYSKEDTVKLAVFDSLLVTQMNALAPSFRELTVAEINTLCQKYYKALTDCRMKHFGLNVKPSLFGFCMDRVSIEGYYNPFTGEGQVSGGLPAFMLPFVICHEMAHQAGIAAEGDANLMAYAVTTSSGDATFRYSAAFSIWQYIDRRLYRKDSNLAKKFEDWLNPLTQKHVAIMDSLSNLSDNDVNRYSITMYDDYLKMQQQKDGIKSYGSIVKNAWLLEKQRLVSKPGLIHIP